MNVSSIVPLVLVILVILNSEFVTCENCTQYYSIRLNNVTGTDYGLLELCDGLQWKAVCDLSWDCSDSYVACKQLGYTNIRISYKVDFGVSNISEFGFAFQSCSTSYSSLSSCGTYSSFYLTSNSYCDPNKDTVGLICTNDKFRCNSGSVRLVINDTVSTNGEGRIEYCYNQRWSPWCTSYGMYARTAYLMCRSLGYHQNSYASIFTDGRYGLGGMPLWLYYVICSSSHNSIVDCTTSGTSGYCPYTCSRTYGIMCHVPTGCTESSLRLANGTVLNEGRLEVCVNGVWGLISTSGFGPTDALIACKQLGYKSGGSVYSSYTVFGEGTGPIVYSSLSCHGYESSLSECSKNDYFNSATQSRQSTVGITCWDGCEEGSVRLTGGSSSNEGTVEICYSRIWGLVSSVGWKHTNVEVVCSQLDFETEGAITLYNFTKPNRAMFLSNVNCDGSEFELNNCPKYKYTLQEGRRLSAQLQPVGVRCKGNETYTTFEYHELSTSPTSISTLHLTTGPSNTMTPTPHTDIGDTEPWPREISVMAVGSVMIAIGVVAIITVIIVIGCFAKKYKNRSTGAEYEETLKPAVAAPQRAAPVNYRVKMNPEKIAETVYETYLT